MPVLRFARDQRGYESTYLVESARGKGGGQSLLYWFRTPPHVKIGRSAFDEEAIRLLEEQHPDVDFDWDRILATRPPAPPEPKDVRYARAERRPVREGRRDEREKPLTPPVPRTTTPPPDAGPPEPAPPDAPVPEYVSSAPDAPLPSGIQTTIVSSVGVPEDTRPARKFVRVFDRADAPPHALTEPSAAERLLGPEKLTILRARYAEIQARITARGGDPPRLDALREQAERVNPDAWVTEPEVAAGLASVDEICAELHRLVGRRRRRRRGARSGTMTGSAAVAGDAGDGEEEVETRVDSSSDEPPGNEPDPPE